jgi:hypothetical protein
LKWKIKKRGMKVTALGTEALTIFMCSNEKVAVAIFLGQRSTPEPPDMAVLRSRIQRHLSTNWMTKIKEKKRVTRIFQKVGGGLALGIDIEGSDWGSWSFLQPARSIDMSEIPSPSE